MVRGFPTAARFRELVSKYGKVAIAVHLSVSAVSISGFYVAIKNNVDVEGVLNKVGLLSKQEIEEAHSGLEEEAEASRKAEISRESQPELAKKDEGKKSVLLSGGSALVLAILCNKALFPVRVPLTFALTPPVARFLARRKLYNPGH